MKAFKLMIAGAMTLASLWSLAEPQVASLRGATDLNQEGSTAPMPIVENKDLKRERAYPQQPPTVPHKIDGYQLDRNYNKCLSCHSRKTAEQSQAVAVSVTHYMNRDGEFLAEVSPARYFCTQCHVIQLDAKPMVENEFIDMDQLIKQKK